MRAELMKENDTGIRYQVLSDALELEEVSENSTGESFGYLEDVTNHGCQSGTCNGLIYYTDTHAFYNEHADECDEILAEYESNVGEGFRFGGKDVRNTLAWMGYEENARKILEEIEEKLSN